MLAIKPIARIALILPIVTLIGCQAPGIPGAISVSRNVADTSRGILGTPTPLPAPIQIQYRPIPAVPYESIGIYSYQQLQLKGSIRHDGVADSRIARIIDATQMSIEQHGRLIEFPVQMQSIVTLDLDGRPWEISKPFIQLPDLSPIRK